ncbi:MAG: NDP-sugar synthase [Firmicutes bacterium]|nr:NDP-sugar synthase [Bacillota bacterium]
MKGIILAGGKGTRLRPLTFSRPKGLVPVVNRPFLEYQLELMMANGINDVILSLSYRAADFRKYFGDGARWGVSISYAIEDVPLGTAGAVKNCEVLLDGQTFIVLNGDVLTDIKISDVLEYHRAKCGEATLTLVRVEDPTVYGVVETNHEGRVTGFIEKPGWEEVTTNTINAGVCVFEPEILGRIERGREVSLERHIFPQIVREGGDIYGYVADGYWLDIGTLQRYFQCHFDILNARLDLMLPGRKFSRGVRMGRDARIHRSARLVGPVILGDRVTIRPGAEVGPWVVVGDEVCVGENAVVVESVIHSHSFIGRRSRVRRCVVESGCQIGEESQLEFIIMAANSTIGRGSLVDPGLSMLV